jgi:hypothetical protein
MSHHVVLTSLSCVIKFFFIIHFFFFILCLILVIIMSLFNFRSYSSSHHTFHHRSHQQIFFFLFSSLLLQCVLRNTRGLWDYYGLVCVCRSINLCAVMKLRIKKILTDFCDTRTHSLRSHAPAFMSLTCGLSHSCEYAAHESKNASHIATLALDVSIPWLVVVFFKGHQQVLPHAIAS